MNRPGQGRPRKPIERHIAEGTLQHYHDLASVPGPITNRPACPAHLEAFDSNAPVLWGQVCDWLTQLGTLSESDSPTIEAFVEAYFHHRKCLALLNNRYAVVRSLGFKKRIGKDGQPMQVEEVEVKANPLDGQCRHWLDCMNRYATQLGLSPVARANLIRNAPLPAPVDSLDAVLAVPSLSIVNAETA